MKIQECITRGSQRLRAAGVQCADPVLHMKQILESCLGLDTSALYLRWEEPLTSEEARAVEVFLDRRCRGEPFQYIVGHEWFWDARFEVGPGVLIPRRETENLVEVLLQQESRSEIRIAELGPGSGNIGIIALRERPLWHWAAYEKNPDTVPYLEKNIKSLLPLTADYRLRTGDFFEQVARDAPFDWIVSNPPYVQTGEFPGLAKEIHWEPGMALDGGARGLDVIQRLIEGAKAWLRPGGRILGEMGAEQGPAVRQCLENNGFGDIRVIQDYGGLDRIFLGRGGD